MATADMATADTVTADTVTTVHITGIAPIIRIRGDIIVIGGNPSLGTFLSWREWSRQLF
jgi:hypothetical protein